MPNALTKKAGPLPVWGWLAAAALGIFLYYRHAQNAAAATTAAGPGFLDPNAVDPNTGLTYGQEMGLGGQLSPTTGATTDGSGGASAPDLSGEISDITNLAGALTGLEQALGQGGTTSGDQTGQTPTVNITVQPESSGKSNAGRKKQKGKKPAKTKATKNRNRKREAKRGSSHRAPAHPGENTNHNHHSHFRPSPARTRIRTQQRERRQEQHRYQQRRRRQRGRR